MIFGLFRKKKGEEELYLEDLERRWRGQPGQSVPPGQPGIAPFKMKVDDVFTIAGRGTVVTGTISAGVISVGGQLRFQGEEGPVYTTVTGIETFRKMLDRAQAGDIVSLLLRGVSRDQISKGTMLRG